MTVRRSVPVGLTLNCVAGVPSGSVVLASPFTGVPEFAAATFACCALAFCCVACTAHQAEE